MGDVARPASSQVAELIRAYKASTFLQGAGPDVIGVVKIIAQMKANPFLFYILWIVVTTIGWSAGILNLDFTVKTYGDVLRLLPIYLASGLLIGLTTGVGQQLVLRTFTGSASGWTRANILGYGLTFLGGIIISVLIPSIVWLSHGDYLLPLTKPSTVSMRMDRDEIFWGGFLLGLMQWPVLRKILPYPTRNKGMLWVLVNWLVLGISMFVSGFTHQSTLAKFQMSIMGLATGAVTGLILLLFLMNSHAPEQPEGELRTRKSLKMH